MSTIEVVKEIIDSNESTTTTESSECKYKVKYLLFI